MWRKYIYDDNTQMQMSIGKVMMIYLGGEKPEDHEIWVYGVCYEQQNGLRSDQIGGII